MTTKPTTIISATTAHDREVREYRPVSFAGDSVLEPRMRLAHGAVSWERPKFGWVKCNVDAAIFESQRRFGLGCVLRNSDGCVLAARCVGRPGMFGAGEAEALSIREALSWLKKLQFPCVVVEMDCLQVFQALTEGFSGPNGFGLMIEECRALAL